MRKPALPEHLDMFRGNLHDNRKPWGPDGNHAQNIVRRRYEWHFSRIHNLQEVKATLRAGSVTSLGAYPLYFITHDGQPMCFDCVRKEFRQVVWDFLTKSSTGWRVVACEVNYEDTQCFCAHCNKQIHSAYGDDEGEKETGEDDTKTLEERDEQRGKE